MTRPEVEWVEIPAGEFVQGLTDRQRADFQQWLYEGYGIGDLEPDVQRWIQKTLKEPLARSPEINRIRKQEVLKRYSPALQYRDAMWALANIPRAKTYFLPKFYIARFPITHAQAKHFYRSPIAKEMGWDKKKRPIGSDEMEDRPEMFMFWEQAEALASWLGGRLPSSLEWEKAARGPNGLLYPWGNEWNPGAGHFRTPEAHKGGDPEKRQGRVTAVDAYPEGASPYSLMDMVGNLGEWHAPDEKGDVGYMAYSIKEMPRHNTWFWALPLHHRPTTRNQAMWYVGCRPVSEKWGQQMWSGCNHEPR